MALTVIYGSRIGDLAAELKERMLKERAESDPFVFSKIVVPNSNIAKWLQIKVFADEPALSMGIEFPFIEQRLSELLVSGLGTEGGPGLLPMNAYANAVISVLLKDDDARLEPFRRYIAGGDGGRLTIDSRGKARMAWQLAVKLADLMDRYEVRRENTIAKWLDKAESAKIADPTEKAEAALAQKLFGAEGVFPPDGDTLSLRQLYERAASERAKPAGEKRKVYLFGVSTLSSLQVKILYWLAKTHDVVIFHNNVCLEYWGDIETEHERVRNRLKTAAEGEDIGFAGEYDNRLLRQWGRAGRETLRLLVDLEEENGGASDPVEFEWREAARRDADDGGVPGCVLGKVQESIRRRVSEIGRVTGQDASVQIVGAPGIRREVEMVYNAILGAVWKPEGSGDRPWSDCSFSDIAVLVPDMDTYRPVIESVFDARGQIPYGIVDTSASGSSRYLAGFNALMSIAREGLTRETVFAALDNVCVQKAFGFGPDDVGEWRRLTEKIGAFAGFEGGEQGRNVSWNAALSRLRLGMVANGGDGLTVCQDGGASALGFSETVELLYRELSPLAGTWMYCTSAAVPDGETDGRNWADCLRRIADVFLRVGDDEPLEENVRRELFRTLYALDGIEGRQKLDFAVEAVQEFVGGIKCRKGGYLTHGVTVAGLHPMRPVPFKQVFVLGMGEGLFPGRDIDSTLEIRGAQRRLGDTTPSETKKFLLLETLMATKERFVLSYPCLDIVKDAELFPSGMVCDRESFMEANILPEDGPPGAGKFKRVRLPLLERGESGGPAPENPVAPIRWEKKWFAGIVPTYSDVERGIAARIAERDVSEGDPTVSGSVRTTDGTCACAPENAGASRRRTVTAGELAEFLDSPLRAVLRRYCGIAVEGYRDGSIDPDPPLEIASGPVMWEFQSKVLSSVSDDRSEADIAAVYGGMADKGKVPEAGSVTGNYALTKAWSELQGNVENLVGLRNFAEGFLPEDGSRPEPVRTLSPAVGSGGMKRGEMLYTGQTSGWVRSADGTTCHVLVYKPCGDRRTGGNVTETAFPPKAVLEPLVTWLMTVAGKEDDGSDHTLRVGIVDIGQMLYNAWEWKTTPAKAKTYVDALADRYIAFLGTADNDGLYLDFGYSDLATALAGAKKRKKIRGDLPASDEEWKAVEFADDDFSYGRSGSFNNDLVIGETMKAWSRLPGDTDAAAVRESFESMHSLPMSGRRIRNGEGA